MHPQSFDNSDNIHWSTLILLTTEVPGREYCSYTGQDASQIQIHVAGVKIQEFSPVLLQMTEGYEVVITLTSEGK